MSPNADIDTLFRAMCACGASDLHLSVGSPPIVRKDGHMAPLSPSAAPLTVATVEALLTPIMPEKNRSEFAARHDTDFAYEIADLARFRANAFVDRNGPGAVFRVIPATPAVSNLIREGKTFQIPSMMQVGKNVGMMTLNDALMELVTKKLVEPAEAYAKAVDKAGMETLLKRVGCDPKMVLAKAL